MSGEDVMPRWLRKATGLGSELGRHEVRMEQTVVRTWPARVFTTRSGRVCRACNTGWMSRLEGRTIPILTPIIQGTSSAVLSAEQQATITLWALKTAMCIQLVESGTWLPIPQMHFQQIYSGGEDGPPLPGCHAWLGRYLPTIAHSRHSTQPLEIQVNGQALAGRFQPYVATLAAGHVAIQTLVVDEASVGFALNYPAGPSRARAMIEIWPTKGELAWAPELAIPDAALTEIALFRTLPKP